MINDGFRGSAYDGPWQHTPRNNAHDQNVTARVLRDVRDNIFREPFTNQTAMWIDGVPLAQLCDSAARADPKSTDLTAHSTDRRSK